jgi:lipoprotein-releasing system permease protein
MALINGFNILLFSVMLGTGISIGLLLSSLLDITVRRKRRQISVLLALGATQLLIKKIFIYYSLFLAVIGFLFSVLLAKLLQVLLWFFVNTNDEELQEHIYLKILHDKIQGIPKPENITIDYALMVLFFVLIICLVSSYYSAVEGSKINPISGLKEG